MPHRQIEIVAPLDALDQVHKAVDACNTLDVWLGVQPQEQEGSGDGERRGFMRVLVAEKDQQKLIDAAQDALDGESNWRMVLLPLEAVIPLAEDEQGDDAEDQEATPREELYDTVERGARLGVNFVIFVLLSTLVATVGMLSGNIAVVVGAMAIAPLLGPNLALALGAALGDRRLMFKAGRTNLAGLTLTLLASVAAGLVFADEADYGEMDAWTDVGLESIAIALASGAAAVLSMATSTASALVGVMVAVALLPPGVAAGFSLGAGEWDQAAGAGILLAVNIVCVNIAAQIVLVAKGIKPRSWVEARGARQSVIVYFSTWASMLAILIGMIVIRTYL